MSIPAEHHPRRTLAARGAMDVAEALGLAS